jgi:hypothetical protein
VIAAVATEVCELKKNSRGCHRGQPLGRAGHKRWGGRVDRPHTASDRLQPQFSLRKAGAA